MATKKSDVQTFADAYELEKVKSIELGDELNKLSQIYEKGGVYFVVKISRGHEFWGIRAKFIQLFESIGKGLGAILLTSTNSGYLFSPAKLRERIVKYNMRPAANGDYKINKPSERELYFVGPEQFKLIWNYSGLNGSDSP